MIKMKGFLEVGKLWKMLPALLFMVTCGVFVVYAATGSYSNFYANYNIETMGNTLTAEGWDSMMKNLDGIVPEGSIIALLSGECPEGWNELEGAEGRFLMGASSGLGDWGGRNTITEVPQHNHQLKYRNREGGTDHSDDDGDLGVIVDYDTNDVPEGIVGHGRDDYFENASPVTIVTSTAGESTSVDITNKYVKVRFCVKGNYSVTEDRCSAGFDRYVTSASCNDWQKFTWKPSILGSFICGKCVYKTCHEKNSAWTNCIYTFAELPAYTFIQTHPIEGNCVKIGCCINNPGVDADIKCR